MGSKSCQMLFVAPNFLFVVMIHNLGEVKIDRYIIMPVRLRTLKEILSRFDLFTKSLKQ